MAFYHFYDNSSYEQRWTRSYGVIPRSHLLSWICADCGRGAKYPAGSLDVKLEGGAAFPDILGWGAYPMMLVSERVLRSWEKAGIESFKAFPVGIESIHESVLQREVAPRYYRIEATGSCIVDLVESGISVTGVCKRCGELDHDPPSAWPLALLPGSWDGGDLFRDQRLFPAVIFCTEHVRDIARRERHTNARFDPTK